MTFEMKSAEALAKGRSGKKPFITDESRLQAELDSYKMPTSIRREWEGSILIVTDNADGTTTRWMFRYRRKQLTSEQIGDPTCGNKVMKPIEWRRSGMWRSHAIALTVLTRWHQDEILQNIRQ